MDNKVKIFVLVIVVLVLGVVATVAIRPDGAGKVSGPGEYDAFAQCLVDQGAVFYAAFWCPYCQTQKKLFGSSQRLLPYVECSLPSGQGQTQECMEKNIKSYPTWEFADGSRLTGQISLAELAEKTSCSLPGTEADALGDINIDSDMQASSPAL